MFDKDKDYELQRWVEKFDEVAFDYEARWGVDALPKLVSDELSEKWSKQIDRLNVAISNRDPRNVQDLVKGCIRGWAVLEKEAQELGHTPNAPDFLETRMPKSGRKLRIYNNHYDAAKKADADTVCWTLQEIVNVIEDNYDLIGKIKDMLPEARVTDSIPFDFNKGDDVP